MSETSSYINTHTHRRSIKWNEWFVSFLYKKKFHQLVSYWHIYMKKQCYYLNIITIIIFIIIFFRFIIIILLPYEQKRMLKTKQEINTKLNQNRPETNKCVCLYSCLYLLNKCDIEWKISISRNIWIKLEQKKNHNNF